MCYCCKTLQDTCIHLALPPGSASVFLGTDMSQDLLAKSTLRQFYYHRTTKQVRWNPPQGWDAGRASAHQEKLRASSRKLLHYPAHNETNHGEGRLCWTGQHAASVNLDLFVTYRLCDLYGPCADTTAKGIGRRPPEWPNEAPKQELPDCPADPVQRHSCEFDDDPRGDARPIRGKFVLHRRWNQGCLRRLASLVTRDCISTRFSCFARWTSPHDL